MRELDYRYQQIKKATWVAVATNLFLAASKITLGVVGQSQALIADGVHSLADLISDIIVLIAAKHGSQQADDEHPYGHGRFETVAEIILGVLLIVVAIGICFDAGSRLYEPETLLSPTWFALLAAFLSIVANEGLFQYTIRIAKELKSKLLTANAWHHRVDAISSVIALLGIAGAMMGMAMLDAVAAIAVSVLILKVGLSITRRGLRELVDTALDPSIVKKIRALILTIDGVKAVHSLRTRSTGANALVDVHLLVVNSRISVSEGHQISEHVMQKVIAEIDDVTDVVVHIDPEDDETNAPCNGLPLRNEVEAELNVLFKECAYYRQHQQINLHYLDGKIFVELMLPVSLINEKQDIVDIAAVFSNIGNNGYIAEIKVVYS